MSSETTPQASAFFTNISDFKQIPLKARRQLSVQVTGFSFCRMFYELTKSDVLANANSYRSEVPAEWSDFCGVRLNELDLAKNKIERMFKTQHVKLPYALAGIWCLIGLIRGNDKSLEEIQKEVRIRPWLYRIHNFTEDKLYELEREHPGLLEKLAYAAGQKNASVVHLAASGRALEYETVNAIADVLQHFDGDNFTYTVSTEVFDSRTGYPADMKLDRKVRNRSLVTEPTAPLPAREYDGRGGDQQAHGPGPTAQPRRKGGEQNI